MPERAQYSVSWSPERAQYLITEPEKADHPLPEAQENWLRWVGEQSRFAFQGRNGRLNVLKERRSRGGEGYWYAYQRHKSGMVKRYIGRDEQLSVERLEEIADLLAKGAEAGHLPASVSQSEQPGASRRTRGRTDRASRGAEVVRSGGVRLGGAQARDIGQAANSIQFEPLLMSKLQAPRLQKALLPREQLLELLDRGLERKLTLIAGPAGYGKTTLVGQWIAQRRARTDFPRVASVTLDEGDNDPIRFWRYIIAACQQLRPGFGEEAQTLLLAHRLPPFKPLTMMLTALLNELSQPEHSSILILDDLHVINATRVTETLGFFIDHLPATCHLIMLIRGDPPLSLARLRAQNEVLDIHPPYLGFSLEETRAFFEQELSFTPPPRVLRQIHERLDGWPAGLRLLAREMHWSVREQDIEGLLAAFAGNHWSVQEYFLGEVLHTLPAAQQEFLLQTSGLPRLTAPLCEAVTGREDSAAVLEVLRGGDLFLIPLDGAGEWSRYHTLFAEAMQLEARRRLGDERLRQLAARASAWYEEHGQLAEAIETALNAGAFARVADLIARLIESKQQGSMPAMAEWYSLNRWLERLPEEELERHPDLCIQYAMSLLFFMMEGTRLDDGRERILHLLQVAEQRWRAVNCTAKLAEIFAFRGLLARQEGKILEAVTWARQSLAWLPLEERERTWRTINLTVVGVGEILGGDLERAHDNLLEALLLNERQRNFVYARATRGMLSWVGMERGELRRTAELLRQMQIEARAQEDHDDIARSQLGLARIAYQWNNLEEAEQAARETLKTGERLNVEEFQAQATARLALIEHARGRTAHAQERIIAWLAQKQTPGSPHSQQLVREAQAALATIQLASGNQAAVEQWFAAIERSEEVLPLLQQRREQVLRARLLLAQGETSTAIALLENICVAAQQTHHIYLKQEIQAVLALAYFRQRAPGKARELLHELLAMTCEEGNLRLFLDEGEAMASLLRWLLPQVHERALLAYARRILSAFVQGSGDTTLETMSDADLLPEPLSTQEQKVLRLLVVGNANAEIARELVVSVNTVRTQLQSIYRKLNVNNRVEASAAARRLELL